MAKNQQPKLTKQQADPHADLVHCRKALENVLGLTRSHAAAICNRLSDEQVDAVLAAGEDKTKVQKAVESAKEPTAPQPESEPKPRTPKK